MINKADIKPQMLMGPGPCDVHPRVLEAMAKPPLGYLDSQFLEILDDNRQMLKAVFQTKNELTLAVSGTGMAGMEACVVNLIEPGDKMLVCVAGFFGNRMREVAERAGALRESHRDSMGPRFWSRARRAVPPRSWPIQDGRHRSCRNLNRSCPANRSDQQGRAQYRGPSAC